MEKLKEAVVSIVRQASQLMMKQDFKINEKDGAANIVTSSDLAVQHFLCEKLKALLPESEFFCEEEDLQHEGEYVWIIDPIDGTANYARGFGESAISVALSHKGEVVFGVVYNPYKEHMFTAECGKGAYLNEIPLRVSERTFGQSLFCTAASLYCKDYAETCFRIMEETYKICNDFRRFGTAALELCYLAAGLCDLYFEIRLFPWDYAAAQLIVREAGGVVRDFDGDLPSLCRPSPVIGANNRENFEMLNEIVHRHMDGVPYGEA